ncbi:hypothetical protein OG762_05790 [Streptomyces sp. NBC_01136]|uniref:hypothetical protein n=1 Tax=unclassified Streptomyces TaxID=2593676 RepID=UPI003250A768|nr:hypothetical protein OG762_05790 [Streptomyces sp. NBC_01136]
MATWLLTASSLVPAAASAVPLGLLTITGLLRVPQLAGPGHWSVDTARRDDLTELSP